MAEPTVNLEDASSTSAGNLPEHLAPLRRDYDFILIDTPPLLSVTDPTVVAQSVDAIILTVGVDKQSRPNAQRAQSLLNGLGLGQKVLGVVINRLRRKSMVYNDGYAEASRQALFD